MIKPIQMAILIPMEIPGDAVPARNTIQNYDGILFAGVMEVKVFVELQTPS